jgi:tRNA pseudouridine55 synthase
MPKIDAKKEIIPIYKPKGWPSFKIVSELRKITGIEKIGFLGTLDPAAEGILVVGIGAGTKKLKDLPHDKEYIAEIALGLKTETWDLEAQNFEFSEIPKIDKIELQKALKSFEGKIEQLIPMFSAKQINGQRLYKLARAGKMLDKLPTKIVEIHKIELLRTENRQIRTKTLPVLTIRVACGTGTFIRSLAYELGQKLGTSATLISIIRTRDGGFELKEAQKIEQL